MLYKGSYARPDFLLTAFPSTIAARELREAYRRFDNLRDILFLLWPVQLFLRRRYRQWRKELLEERSNIIHWGGLI